MKFQREVFGWKSEGNETCLKKRILAFWMLIMMLIYVISEASITVLGVETEEIPFLIEEYCRLINEGEYLKLANLVDSTNASEYNLIFNNAENKKNNIGIMNVEEIKILDICHTSDFDEFEKYYGKEEYIYPEYYVLKTEMLVKEERENDFVNGENYLAIVIAEENSTRKIFDIFQLNYYQGEKYFNNSNSRATNYDYSVECTENVWVEPTTIRIELSDGTIKSVNFYDYCVISSACEFGNAWWSENTKKACALALKNYTWRLVLEPRKHSTKGYHVGKSDQAYNENVDPAKINAVDEAVAAIWDYVMLDSEYKLFSAFYCAKLNESKTNHEAFARQYGGVLSQNGAYELGNNGMSWENILHYYYDTNANVEKHDDILPNGPIKIVNLNHTPIYSALMNHDEHYHWRKCTICNCAHVKTIHNFRPSGGGTYTCTNCRYYCVK